MGLRAKIDLADWNFPTKTPVLGIEIEYTDVGKTFGETAQESAQSVCPVDTGFLQSSISGSGDDMTGQVEATAEYAQYVEYGTWKMRAQPYFKSAVEASARSAFDQAMEIYNNALEEEQNEIEAIAAEERRMQEEMEREAAREAAIEAAAEAAARRGSSGSSGGGGGTFGNGRTQNVKGIEFNRDGSVGAGTHGYYQTNPNMWRKDTVMYSNAVSNLRNLSSLRAEAMSRFAYDDAVRARSSYGGGGGGGGSRSSYSGATSFGYGVGMYALSSAMLNGSSFLGGLMTGMLAGGIATFAAMVLSEAFGNQPEFTMPEIEIF